MTKIVANRIEQRLVDRYLAGVDEISNPLPLQIYEMRLCFVLAHAALRRGWHIRAEAWVTERETRIGAAAKSRQLLPYTAHEYVIQRDVFGLAYEARMHMTLDHARAIRSLAEIERRSA